MRNFRLHSLVVAWLLPSAFCSLTIAVPANISLYEKRRSWETYWRETGKFSCFFRRESDSDDDLILGNSDVCQVGRLDAEVCHVNGTGCRSRDRVPHNFSLHVKHLFVGLAMHRQVAGQLKMNGLPITIARR